jgi:hypothetical protein
VYCPGVVALVVETLSVDVKDALPVTGLVPKVAVAPDGRPVSPDAVAAASVTVQFVVLPPIVTLTVPNVAD